MDSTLVVSVSGLVFAVIVSAMAGGAISAVIRRITADKVAIAYADKLYMSFPPATQEVFGRLTDTLDSVVGLLKAVQTPPTDTTTPPTATP